MSLGRLTIKNVLLRHLRWMAAAALSLTATPLYAVDPASAAIVYKGIQDSLEQVNSLAETAGSEVKGAALQLEMQLKDLLAVLDDRLENRIDESFDRLDDSQKLLTRNAQQTLESTREAMDALRAKSFNSAEELLHEADMSAYNTLYSLPCRDKIPRIVYSTPKALRVGSSQVEQLTIHGNFLRLGDTEPVVKFGDRKLKIDALGDNDISVSLPIDALRDVKKPTPMSLTVEGLTKISTFNLLVGCPSFKRSVTEPVRTQLVVRPELIHTVAATLLGKVNAVVRHPEAFKFNYTENAGSCSTNVDASKKYCLQPDSNWTVGRADVTDKYTRCPSSIGAAVTAKDDRCVVVPARLKSCGRRWGDCKGTGKISYTITLEGVEHTQETLNDMILPPVTLRGPSSASTAFRFEVPQGTDPASLRYIVNVISMEGTTKVREVTLTPDLGHQAGYRAELDPSVGVLTVQVPNVD